MGSADYKVGFVDDDVLVPFFTMKEKLRILETPPLLGHEIELKSGLCEQQIKSL
jgi:hypothetical protein